MLWPILWILAMLGLVVTVATVAMREKKARAKALKEFAPQPLDGEEPVVGEAVEDGFGEADPVDSFGTGEAGDFAELDQDAFK